MVKQSALWAVQSLLPSQLCRTPLIPDLLLFCPAVHLAQVQESDFDVKVQGIMIGNPVTDNYIDNLGKASMLGGLGLLPETMMGQLQASGCGSTISNPFLTEDYNFVEVCTSLFRSLPCPMTRP